MRSLIFGHCSTRFPAVIGLMIFTLTSVVLIPETMGADDPDGKLVTIEASGGKAIYFNGDKQYAEFPYPTGMPSGSSPRTIECWVKLDDGGGANQAIIDVGGNVTVGGQAFGIHANKFGKKTEILFWGHYTDARHVATIYDNAWHFLALTFDGNLLRFYLDGVKTYEGARPGLNTVAGTCYLGGNPKYDWYLKGAVKNITLWSTVREYEQIKYDMIPYPCLGGSENGLVAHFPTNEQNGTTFASADGRVTGTLKQGSTFTKPIPSNPEPIDEGIWFVIQNKADLDHDYGIPARRLALRVNDQGTVTMEAVPLTGDYDAFLWRTEKDGPDRYKLINKKLGKAKALDSSLSNFTIGNFGNYVGQAWTLSRFSRDKMGTNAYQLSNNAITTAKAYAYEGNGIVVRDADFNLTNQAWIFQPMEIVAGYHIPAAETENCPFTKKLTLDNGFVLYATNTTSDWATLNTHLIIKNEMEAMNNTYENKLADNSCTIKQIQIISAYDFDNAAAAKYPMVKFNEAWMAANRGGNGFSPPLNVSLVTEEIMCVTRYFNGKRESYREFEQVVHEFAHGIDYMCSIESSSAPLNDRTDKKAEWFPWEVQYWLNSGQSGENLHRSQLAANIQEYLENYFDPANTWLPPRTLRTRYQAPSVYLAPGSSLTVDQKMYTPDGNHYLVMQSDGNVVIYTQSNQPIWASGTYGKGNGCHLDMQDDGHLVLYSGSGRAIWASGTHVSRDAKYGTPAAKPVRMVFENGGAMVLYSATGEAVWSSKNSAGENL